MSSPAKCCWCSEPRDRARARCCAASTGSSPTRRVVDSPAMSLHSVAVSDRTTLERWPTSSASWAKIPKPSSWSTESNKTLRSSSRTSACPSPRCAAGSRRRSTPSGSHTFATARLPPCRGANASARRSPVRWPPRPRPWCSTNRLPSSTRKAPKTCSPRLAASTPISERRCCWPNTASSGPRHCRTGQWSSMPAVPALRSVCAKPWPAIPEPRPWCGWPACWAGRRCRSPCAKRGLRPWPTRSPTRSSFPRRSRWGGPPIRRAWPWASPANSWCAGRSSPWSSAVDGSSTP